MQTHLDLWMATRWAADLQRAASLERTVTRGRIDRTVDRPRSPIGSPSTVIVERPAVGNLWTTSGR
jgi:hypothetical protein